MPARVFVTDWFQDLLAETVPVYNASRCGASRVSVESKLLLTVWALATHDSFRQIGDRFGFDRGVAHSYYAEVSHNALLMI